MNTRSVGLASVIAVIAAFALAGCATHDSAKGRHSSQARRSIPGSAFEATAADPPIASDTRFAAGQLAESRGALPQAADQYKRALRDNPRHVDAMYRLGIVYASMQKYAEAVEVWKRYVKATNESAAGYSNLGFCYELAGKPEEAEATYQKGIRKDPKHVACRVNYGLMLVRRGRENEGKLQLQAVLTPAEVRYNVGSVYESMARKQQAKAEYEAALRLDPSLADAQSRLDELQGKPKANVPMAQTDVSPATEQAPLPSEQSRAPQPTEQSSPTQPTEQTEVPKMTEQTGVSQTTDSPIEDDE